MEQSLVLAKPNNWPVRLAACRVHPSDKDRNMDSKISCCVMGSQENYMSSLCQQVLLQAQPFLSVVCVPLAERGQGRVSLREAGYDLIQGKIPISCWPVLPTGCLSSSVAAAFLLWTAPTESSGGGWTHTAEGNVPEVTDPTNRLWDVEVASRGNVNLMRTLGDA